MKINTFRRVFERQRPGRKRWGHLQIRLTPLALLIFVLPLLTTSQPALAQKSGETSGKNNVITIPPDPTNGASPVVVTVVPKNSPKAPQDTPNTLPAQSKQGLTPTPAATAQDACPNPPGTPSDAIFRDLKGVNFYIWIPNRLHEALKCHGHEAECAQQYSDHERYAQQLKDDYDAYPPLLHPENLTQLFVKQIEQTVSPFVHRDDQCKTPGVQILDKTNLIRSVYQKDTLTVTVKLVVDGDGHPPTRPRLSVLSMHLFRPDCGHSSYDVDVIGAGVMTGGAIIPLDLSESDLAKRLDYVVAHSQVTSVGVDEDIEGIHKH